MHWSLNTVSPGRLARRQAPALLSQPARERDGRLAYRHDEVASLGHGAAEGEAEAADITPDARADSYGRFIAPHIIGVNHDHYFSFRVDLDVDGMTNDFVIDRLVPKRLDGNRQSVILLR